MTPQKSSPPSVQEMGARIMKNLTQVQGYLDILKTEIDDPEKSGPGTSCEEWKRLTIELSDRLTDLDNFLKSKDWESLT